MSATVYHYPSCSTCRKALKWLDSQGITYQAIHLVESTPSANKLKNLHRRSGLPVRRLFNTAGNSYREGGFKEKLETMRESEALAALAADGMLIKRPILDTHNTVLVGFKEAEWQAAFAAE